MKIKSFKFTILIFNFSFFILFSSIIFYYFNNFYINEITKNFIKDNIYATNVAFQFIEEEQNIVSEKSRTAKNNPTLNSTFSKYNPKKNKILFLQAASFVFNTSIKHHSQNEDIFMELFDENLNIITTINNYDKDEISTGTEDYLLYAFDKENQSILRGSKTFSTYIFLNNKLFIKGFSRFYSDKILGLVVISVSLNKNFITRLKKITNHEIILFDKNFNILEHSFSPDTSIKIKEKKLFPYDNYILIDNSGSTFRFDLKEIKDYKNNSAGFIASGFNISNIKTLYLKNMGNFLIQLFIFFTILIFAFYFIFQKIFYYFSKIINSIEKISTGDFNPYADNYYFSEFQTLNKTIVSMASSLKKRESELIKSTKENYFKNFVLSNIGHEIKTPLNAIINLSRILYEKTGFKENKEILQIISNERKFSHPLKGSFLSRDRSAPFASGKLQKSTSIPSLGSKAKYSFST